MHHFVKLHQRLDEICHVDISSAESPAIVGCQSDLNLVVNIEPLRMMIHLVCLQSNSRHKSEGLIEIFEKELFINGALYLFFLVYLISVSFLVLKLR